MPMSLTSWRLRLARGTGRLKPASIPDGNYEAYLRGRRRRKDCLLHCWKEWRDLTCAILLIAWELLTWR